MLSGGRKLILIALIVLDNLVWWFSYQRTETMLDEQLGHRLAAVARTAVVSFPPALVDSLALGDLDAYLTTVSKLERVRKADSLSEVFILDEDYLYLASTLLEPDSVYFLSGLNGDLIDLVLFDLIPNGEAGETYRSGDFYLKSAFAPLRGGDGNPRAVLGVEANVDYFESLADLRQNLYYASGLSLLGGAILGLIFLLIQRQLSIAEQKLVLGETHAHLGRMVAVVAHELKNPLMIIRGSAERLKRKTEMAEADYVVEEVDRLDRIVTGYLDFASAGNSLLALDSSEPINLAEFASDLKKHLTARYPDAQVDWVGSPPPPELTIMGYRRSLRQVLLNLLFNGVEASQAANRPLWVGLTATVENDTLILAVTDRGEGLDRKQQKKLFTPFHTTKQAGSGLGLYLSRRLVEQMGGKLRVESKPGEGASFVIHIPHEPKG